MCPKVPMCEILTCTFLSNSGNSRAKRGKVKNHLKLNILKWLWIWAMILVPFKRELKMLLFKKKFEDFRARFQKLLHFFVFRISRNAVWSQIGGCSYLGNYKDLEAEIFRVSFFWWYNNVYQISCQSEDTHGDTYMPYCRFLGAEPLKYTQLVV